MFRARVAFGILALSGSAAAQQYLISTYAGGAPPPTPIAAPNAAIGLPQCVAVDSAGNVYFSSSLSAVFRIDTSGILTRVAGNARMGYSGDGGQAVNAQLAGVTGIALDRLGNLYIADTLNNRVREVAVSGTITTVAGNGVAGYSGDGGTATQATLSGPTGVAVDPAGNLYIADADNSRIRKVSTGGVITTVAGTGVRGYFGDQGVAANAQLSLSSQFGRPSGLAMDSAGNLYIADTLNNRVRMISAAGTITTVAGNGSSAGVPSAGDGGTAVSAQVAAPTGLAFDSAGNLYIGSSAQVRKVSTTGFISTAAGTGTPGYSGDGAPAIGAAMGRVPGIAVDGAGSLYIADGENHVMRKVTPDGNIASIAGNGLISYSGDGGPATIAQLFFPTALTLDGSGNLYIADTSNNRVRKVSPGGTITTVAGNGVPISSGDYGPAAKAGLKKPRGVALDGQGNIYIAESDRIRMIGSDGTVTTVAGGGSGGLADGGPATSATLVDITGIAIDTFGNLFIADPYNYRVRRVSAGVISTYAGGGTATGTFGDGGRATDAQLSQPQGIAVDASGNLFIADPVDGRIRKVTPAGVITTVAGNGSPDGAGDGGPATKALISPAAVAVDAGGNLYVADNSLPAARVRKVTTSGTITTIAGSAASGYSGDGAAATGAALSSAVGLAVDRAGNVYVSDSNQNALTGLGNSAVRLLQPQNTSVAASIRNSASNLPGAISPGEIIVIVGAGLGPAQLTLNQPGGSGNFGCQLAGTAVSFNGTCAPMIYTSATQVAAVVPYSVSGATAQVSVSYQGQTAASLEVPVAAAAPGIFTLDSSGKGPGACINQDGSINTPSTPAKAGDFIACFATGEGQTSPPGVDGKLAASPLPRPNLPVSVLIGGQVVTPQYAGGAPGLVAGVIQVNAQIPAGIQTGNAIPLFVQVGSATSQSGVTIAVR
ncbi:MAG: hypothetical protein JST11_18195 [Acidobacteria bacterium]|nr:hypothetical protein [Acidobacteriota bacterium]